MQQREENSQRQLRDCDWIIARHEIRMTDKCLGRGGWGSVYEGVYCGCAVAVKQIHDLILSPHNIRLFNREMEIASKCHHPHLLQFIGATNDEESPLFVTELMENNLRTLLEQRQLSEREIRMRGDLRQYSVSNSIMTNLQFPVPSPEPKLDQQNRN